MRRQQGFTYLGLLLAVALLGLGLAAASEVWSTVARRQRMEQLEWVGRQYVQAIGSYYESSPGGVKVYPKTLDDLLEDRRFPFVKRHLRQIYANPFPGGANWNLVQGPDGRVRGIQAQTSPVAQSDEKGRTFEYSPSIGLGVHTQ